MCQERWNIADWACQLSLSSRCSRCRSGSSSICERLTAEGVVHFWYMFAVTAVLVVFSMQRSTRWMELARYVEAQHRNCDDRILVDANFNISAMGHFMVRGKV